MDRLHGAFRKETRHHAVPAGFGEPQEGAWDGFQRINTETGSGGFVGVFRQGAAESSRTVTVKYLKPTATYSILSFPDDKEFGKLTGKELLEKNRGIVCNPIVVRSAPANAVKYAKAIIDKI